MRKIHWFILLVILLFPILGILFYPYLPEQIGIHWSRSDEPDDYMGKFAGTFVPAGICIIVVVSLVVVCEVMSGAYNSKAFRRWCDCFIILFPLFLLYSDLLVLLWNAGVKMSVPSLMKIGAVLLLVLIGVISVYFFGRKKAYSVAQAEIKNVPVVSDGSYKDKLVEIDDETMVFKHYYFPKGAKRVKLCQVEYIQDKMPTLWNGKWRLHGTGNFNTWFAADMQRPIRDKIFVMKVKNKWIRMGFTVENSEAVSKLFSSKGLLR